MPDLLDVGRIVADQQVVELADDVRHHAVGDRRRGGDLAPAGDAVVSRHFDEKVLAPVGARRVDQPRFQLEIFIASGISQWAGRSVARRLKSRQYDGRSAACREDVDSTNGSAARSAPDPQIAAIRRSPTRRSEMISVSTVRPISTVETAASVGSGRHFELVQQLDRQRLGAHIGEEDRHRVVVERGDEREQRAAHEAGQDVRHQHLPQRLRPGQAEHARRIDHGEVETATGSPARCA